MDRIERRTSATTRPSTQHRFLRGGLAAAVAVLMAATVTTGPATATETADAGATASLSRVVPDVAVTPQGQSYCYYDGTRRCYFEWAASFRYKVTSNNYWADQGDHRWRATCTSKPTSPAWGKSYLVTLMRDRTLLKDVSYGGRSFACNRTPDKYTWGNLPEGQYYFVLTKLDDGRTMKLKGRIHFTQHP